MRHARGLCLRRVSAPEPCGATHGQQRPEPRPETSLPPATATSSCTAQTPTLYSQRFPQTSRPARVPRASGERRATSHSTARTSTRLSTTRGSPLGSSGRRSAAHAHALRPDHPVTAAGSRRSRSGECSAPLLGVHRVGLVHSDEIPDGSVLGDLTVSTETTPVESRRSPRARTPSSPRCRGSARRRRSHPTCRRAAAGAFPKYVYEAGRRGAAFVEEVSSIASGALE